MDPSSPHSNSEVFSYFAPMVAKRNVTYIAITNWVVEEVLLTISLASLGSSAVAVHKTFHKTSSATHIVTHLVFVIQTLLAIISHYSTDHKSTRPLSRVA